MAIICTLKECDHHAIWRVGITMHAPFRYEPSPPVYAKTGVVLCEDHNTLTLDDIVSDEGWAMIVVGFVAQGRVPPDRSRNELVYYLIADDTELDRRLK